MSIKAWWFLGFIRLIDKLLKVDGERVFVSLIVRDLDAGRGWFCRYAVRQAKAAGTAMAERRIREEIDEVIGFMIDVFEQQ